MIIGVPKEIKLQEHRVALLPSAVYQLCKRGHQVVVERSAGAGSGYPDADYESAGAEMTSDHKAVFEKAGMIVKVKEPQESEYPLLHPGQILFTYLHLAASRSLTEALLKSGVAAHRLRNNRGAPAAAVAGADERNRRPHVHPGGGIFSGEAQRWKRGVAGRCAGRFAGACRGAGRRHGGINAARMATGLGPT